MNPTDAHLCAFAQPGDILEIGVKMIGPGEQELLAADPEHSPGENKQRRDDKYSQSKSSGHNHRLRTVFQKLTHKLVAALFQIGEGSLRHYVSLVHQDNSIRKRLRAAD